MIIVSLLLFFGLENGMPLTAETISDSNSHDQGVTVIQAPLKLNKNFSYNTLNDSISESYDLTKEDINQLRFHLNEKLRRNLISLDSVKAVFTNHLVDKIIPHWYGTPWSFGGHTAVPNQGEIACGYFISTTLRDMGVKLNRYRLAQKSPIDEARSISCGSEIFKIEQESPEKAISEIDALTREGVYFIGFDKSHVGYLLKRKGELFLIHSNYLYPSLVCMERIEESRAFKSYATFHLVEISNNDTLMQLWLENKVVL